MKLIFTQFICLNAVILLTSGILIGEINLKSSISTSIKKIHYCFKTDLNLDTFSFVKTCEEENTNHNRCSNNCYYLVTQKLKNLNVSFHSTYIILAFFSAGQ